MYHFIFGIPRLFAKWCWLTLLSLGILSLLISSFGTIWIIALSPFVINGWLVTITRRGALDYVISLRQSLSKKRIKSSDEPALSSENIALKKEWHKENKSKIRYGVQRKGMTNSGKNSLFSWFTEKFRLGTHDFKVGFKNWAGVWVWTLPGLSLMWFGWYSGWQISFNKIYEYSGVGFTLSTSGWILMAAVMPLVVMGMSRYSLAEDWKVFFQAKRNWRWVRRAGWRNLIIAAIFVISSLPFGILYVILYFWPDILMQTFPETFNADGGFSGDQVKLQIFLFYFGGTFLFLLPTWIVSRYLIGHYYYAPTLLHWLRQRRVRPNEISEGEVLWLERCGFLPRNLITDINHQQKRGFWSKRITPPARIFIILMSGLLWLVFSFLISLAQFARYSGLEGWFNHPLIHNPHFYYTPGSSQDRPDSYNLEENPAFQDDFNYSID